MSVGMLLGIFLHSLKSVNEINKRNNKTDFKQVFAEYWAHDKLSIFTAVFCSAVLLFIASEFIHPGKIDNPDVHDTLQDKLLHFRIANFVKVTAVIAGYFADSIIYGFMGVTEKRIQKRFADDTPQLQPKP